MSVIPRNVKSVVSLVVCGLFFLSGYQLRGLEARLAKAKSELAVTKESVEAVKQARTDDKLTQVGAAAVEAIRVDQAADNAKNFQIIYRDVIKYVQSNPNPAACNPDAEWLRIWNAANSGRVDDPEPIDPPRSVGGVPATDGAGSQGQRRPK